MENKTTYFLDLVNSEKTKFSVAFSDTFDTGFDISPQEFLKYAEEDLENEYDHCTVNALSNSKRALDCQLDTLLILTGYYKKSQDGFWGFPKKIELVNELNILAPRILKKINKQRNLLEHRFVKPQKENVEDFLDISMLFIGSTDRYTLSYKPIIQLKNSDKRLYILIFNDYKNSKIVAQYFDLKDDPYYSEITQKLINQSEKKSSESDLSDSQKKTSPKEKAKWEIDESDYKLVMKRYLEFIK